MSGNTGKMTREAIEARGPRYELLEPYAPGGSAIGFVICREDQKVLRTPFVNRYATSYSLSYLRKVALGLRGRFDF